MKTFVNLTVLLMVVLGFAACDKSDSNDPDEIFEVTIKNTEDYSYDFGFSGDEEGATIVTQAKHYQKSDIARNGDFNVIYQYTPESGFIGSDFVEIETCTGGGVNCSHIELVRINFSITN